MLMPVESLPHVAAIVTGIAFSAITPTAWVPADEQMTWPAFVSFDT
jgi:hypothetical protein